MVRLGLVVAEFNQSVTEAMEEDARERATVLGAEIVVTHHVPGSYDTPLAADRLARREDVDAVAVIGAIVTGDTDHDQVIARAALDQLATVERDRDTPIAMGITGPGMSGAEARERVEIGGRTIADAVHLVEELGEPDTSR
ncbi:MAG: 6,7-dimethyl-8-ribityllumazine synthase [Salinarchaeum sp.]